MKFSTIIKLTFLICKIADKSNLASSITAVDFIQIFENCYFQVYLPPTYLTADLSKISSLNHILNFFRQQQIVFSVRNFIINSTSYHRNNSIEISYHFTKVKKCLVQTYFISEHSININQIDAFVDFAFFFKDAENDELELIDNSSVTTQSENETVTALNSTTFYFKILTHFYPAVLFEIEDFLNVNLICIPCLVKATVFEPIPKNFQINHRNFFTQLWRSIYSNLNNLIVVTARLGVYYDEKYHTIKTKMTPCYLYSLDFIDPYICTNLMISRKLNYSLYDIVKYALPHAKVSSQFIVGGDNNFIAKNSRMNWISTAAKATPYEFVTIVNKLPGNFEAILKPFDWFTWIAIFSASVGVIIIFQFAGAGHMKRKVTLMDIQGKVLHILCFILDQPTGKHFFANCTHFVIMIIWALWSIFSLNISQYYKGSILSFLSISPHPVVPQDLNSLVDEGHLIMSSDTYYRMWDNGTEAHVGSVLKEMLLPNLIENFKSHVGLNGNVYERLNKSLVWISNGAVQQIASMAKNDSFIHGGYQYYTTNATFPIPEDNFVILDPEDRVFELTSLISIFSQKYISKVYQLPVFMQRDSWMVFNNFFAPCFINSLSQIYESGIFLQWSKISTMRNQRAIVQTIHGHLKINGAFGVPFKRLFNFMIMANGLKVDSRERGNFNMIPNSVYKTIFIYQLILFGLGFLLFLLELTRYKCTKRNAEE